MNPYSGDTLQIPEITAVVSPGLVRCNECFKRRIKIKVFSAKTDHQG